MRVIVDHVAGSRRGQRQEFSAGSRVRFGRHPECEVAFDPHRDIDASSRHAELRSAGTPPDAWLLVDLGSSNGTYVDGRRITEATVEHRTPIAIEFGSGGPRVRLFVGDDAAIEALPPAPLERVRRNLLVPGVVFGIVAVVFAIVVLVLK